MDMFALLGATPELGRTFLPDEDEANHFVVVLEHQFWKQQFGGDPGIIGRTITLNKRAYTVVGVMPAGFAFPLQRKPVSVWTTFSEAQTSDDNSTPITKQRGAHFFNVIARLKPGVSIAQAQAAMDVITSALAKQYPDTNKYSGVELEAEREHLTGTIRPVLILLMAAVGLVLLIACVNVANLLLARATTRGREIAIRSALGAGRSRVVRQLLTESMLLAGLAGGLGMIIAAWGSAILVRLSPQDLPRAAEIHTDGWVFAFTAGISLLTGLVFGLAPAVQTTRSNLVDALKEGSLSTTAGSGRHHLRSSLVIVEMALALVLLVSSGLLIRSLAAVARRKSGIRSSQRAGSRSRLSRPEIYQREAGSVRPRVDAQARGIARRAVRRGCFSDADERLGNAHQLPDRRPARWQKVTKPIPRFFPSLPTISTR